MKIQSPKTVHISGNKKGRTIYGKRYKKLQEFNGLSESTCKFGASLSDC